MGPLMAIIVCKGVTAHIVRFIEDTRNISGQRTQPYIQ